MEEGKGLNLQGKKKTLLQFTLFSNDFCRNSYILLLSLIQTIVNLNLFLDLQRSMECMLLFKSGVNKSKVVRGKTFHAIVNISRRAY